MNRQRRSGPWKEGLEGCGEVLCDPDGAGLRGVRARDTGCEYGSSPVAGRATEALAVIPHKSCQPDTIGSSRPRGYSDLPRPTWAVARLSGSSIAVVRRDFARARLVRT